MGERCPYCGRWIDEGLTDSLENGSPACAQCVADEEKQNKEREERMKEK